MSDLSVNFNYKIMNGDRVTIVTPQGNLVIGKAVGFLVFSDHLVINVGGRYGTPAVADETNIKSIKRGRKVIYTGTSGFLDDLPLTGFGFVV